MLHRKPEPNVELPWNLPERDVDAPPELFGTFQEPNLALEPSPEPVREAALDRTEAKSVLRPC